jgi:predicted PurR-regulated permease PerM
MSSGALWAIVVIVFVNSLFIAGIAVALWQIHAKLNELVQQARPLVGQAEAILGRAEETFGKVDQQVTSVLDSTEHLVRDVSRKVETTTSIAEETISQPLIGAASLMAGIHRGLSAYREMTEKGDGRNDG